MNEGMLMSSVAKVDCEVVARNTGLSTEKLNNINYAVAKKVLLTLRVLALRQDECTVPGVYNSQAISAELRSSLVVREPTSLCLAHSPAALGL